CKQRRAFAHRRAAFGAEADAAARRALFKLRENHIGAGKAADAGAAPAAALLDRDRKSTRLNSSHSQISYAVFCLKKKTIRVIQPRSVLSPVECSVGTKPRNPPSWRMFLSSRQSPMRARS